MCFLMSLQIVLLCKALVAELALEVLLLGVRLDVPLQAHVLTEHLSAEATNKLSTLALSSFDGCRIWCDGDSHRAEIVLLFN